MIQIDPAQCAQMNLDEGVPLLAILAHELIHIAQGKPGQLSYRPHGRRFHSACVEMSCHGIPVITARLWYPVLEEAEPCDWLGSMAMVLRAPTALVKFQEAA